MTNIISQFSSVNALISGLCDGVFSAEEILAHGDFGLGCSHALGGEVIIIDGKIIEARGDGIIRIMEPKAKLPFAQVTKFNAEKSIAIENITKITLHDFLSSHLKFDNIFLALKFEGIFKKLKIRRPIELTKPYKSVLDAAHGQIVEEFENIDGTFVGFFTPNFFSLISVAQFHVHFLSKDGRKSGHIMDFDLAKGDLSFQKKITMNIHLPNDPDYLDKDLNIDGMVELIQHIEN